jgi:hypothetical protein
MTQTLLIFRFQLMSLVIMKEAPASNMPDVDDIDDVMLALK